MRLLPSCRLRPSCTNRIKCQACKIWGHIAHDCYFSVKPNPSFEPTLQINRHPTILGKFPLFPQLRLLSTSIRQPTREIMLIPRCCHPKLVYAITLPLQIPLLCDSAPLPLNTTHHQAVLRRPLNPPRSGQWPLSRLTRRHFSLPITNASMLRVDLLGFMSWLELCCPRMKIGPSHPLSQCQIYQ